MEGSLTVCRNEIALGVVGATLLYVSLGCANDGMVTCSGTVTFDGVPLPAGAISFHSSDTRIAPQGAQVVDGSFRIRCRPGRQRVEIYASRPKARAEELTPGMTPMEQFIPARYNEGSTLEVDVVPNGPNRFPFELVNEPVTKAG